MKWCKKILNKQGVDEFTKEREQTNKALVEWINKELNEWMSDNRIILWVSNWMTNAETIMKMNNDECLYKDRIASKPLSKQI